MKDVSEIAPDLVNASCPFEGVVASGQPTAGHLKRLAEAGYRTVLDLRASDENRGFDEATVVREAGMKYVNLPLEAKPEAFTDGAFDQARDLLGDTKNRPMLLHCGTASRVGTLVVPYLILDEGKSLEEAMNVASGIGSPNRELIRRAFDYAESR